LGRLKLNALLNNSPSEFAKITHPFHPLHGKRYPILKKRRVSGRDTLVLKGSSMGTFAVPEEWTDKNNPSGDKPCNSHIPILHFQCLFDLRQLVIKIAKKSKNRVDNEVI
jgi:hypothetical protein